MATQHLTDDELVLHYYGETAPEQEQRAAAHLEACGPCRGEYVRLQHVLGAIDESAVAVEPPPSFERTVWARLEPNLRPARRGWASWLMLAGAARPRRRRGRPRRRRLLRRPGALAGAVAPAAATAAALNRFASAFFSRTSASISIARRWPSSSWSAPTRTRPATSRAIAHAPSSSSPTAGSIGRRRKQTGDVALSELLDEIERVLTEVAASPQSGSSRDLADVRRRIESRDLLFKVRVVSSEIRERQKSFEPAAGGAPLLIADR